MYRFLEYTLLFVIVVLLQIFLFNNLNLSVYVNPLVYIAFVVMLPMEINRAALLLLGFLLGGEQETIASVLMGFGGIFLSQWLLYIFYCMIRRKSFEVETMAFFLCTMGMAAIATVKPGETTGSASSQMPQTGSLKAPSP